jgi:hypothetical protein
LRAPRPALSCYQRDPRYVQAERRASYCLILVAVEVAAAAAVAVAAAAAAAAGAGGEFVLGVEASLFVEQPETLGGDLAV